MKYHIRRDNKQGKFSEGEALYKRVIEIWVGQHGPQHPDVALGLNKLGNAYRAMGDAVPAEPLFLKSLVIRGKLLGVEHPDVGTTLQNRAELYRDLERKDEAERLYRCAVAITEKALGKNHPDAVEMRAGNVRDSVERAHC